MLFGQCFLHLCRSQHPNVDEQLLVQEYNSKDEFLILRYGGRRNICLLTVPLKDAFDVSFAGGHNHERGAGYGFCHSDTHINDHYKYVAYQAIDLLRLAARRGAPLEPPVP